MDDPHVGAEHVLQMVVGRSVHPEIGHLLERQDIGIERYGAIHVGDGEPDHRQSLDVDRAAFEGDRRDRPRQQDERQEEAAGWPRQHHRHVLPVPGTTALPGDRASTAASTTMTAAIVVVP